MAKRQTTSRRNITLKVPKTIDVALDGCPNCRSSSNTTVNLSERGTYRIECPVCHEKYQGTYTVNFTFSKPDSREYSEGKIRPITSYSIHS